MKKCYFILFLLSGMLLFSCKYNMPDKPIAYPTDSISLGVDNLVMQEGTSIELTVDYNTTKNVIWSTSHPYIASISSSGIVTAHQTGEVTIFAQCYEFNGAIDSVRLSVKSIMEKEYVPNVLLDFGATTKEIENYEAAKQIEKEVKKEDLVFTYTNTNSVTQYHLLKGSQESMLLKVTSYVWGKPDSIENILNDRYQLIYKDKKVTTYEDTITKTTISVKYVSAEQSKKNNYLYNQNINNDYFIITYDGDFDEILVGKLVNSSLDITNNICLVLGDGEMWHISNLSNNTFPFAFRDYYFYENDEVIAIGNFSQEIINKIEIKGIIHNRN